MRFRVEGLYNVLFWFAFNAFVVLAGNVRVVLYLVGGLLLGGGDVLLVLRNGRNVGLVLCSGKCFVWEWGTHAALDAQAIDAKASALFLSVADLSTPMIARYSAFFVLFITSNALGNSSQLHLGVGTKVASLDTSTFMVASGMTSANELCLTVEEGMVDVEGVEPFMSPCIFAIAAGAGKELFTLQPNCLLMNVMGKLCVGLLDNEVMDGGRVVLMRSLLLFICVGFAMSRL